MDREKVMSWLEGLAEPDWRDFHSDSEVQNIAKSALELLKAQRETIDELISADKALKLLKEQDELLKHEYWRGYNNGRADERGLQEGTIMQTFSPD